MPSKVFVNYRRDDEPNGAARVRDGLAVKFGKSNVFMDVDNLLAGQRFDEELSKALSECDVLVAVIGPRWMELLKARAAGGERDYVRVEISEALARRIIVIPVLVGRNRQMPSLPRHEELPEDIRDLVLYQKHDVAYERFGRDIAELTEAILTVQQKNRPEYAAPRVPWGWVPATAASVLAIGYAGAYYTGVPVPWPRTPPAETRAAETASRSRADDEAKARATEVERLRVAAPESEEVPKRREAEAAKLRADDEARRQADEDARGRAAANTEARPKASTAASKAIVNKFGPVQYITGFAEAPSGTTVAIFSGDSRSRELAIWDANGGRKVKVLAADTRNFSNIRWSAGAQSVIAIADEREIVEFHVGSGLERRVFRSDTPPIKWFGIAENGALAVLSENNILTVVSGQANPFRASLGITDLVNNFQLDQFGFITRPKPKAAPSRSISPSTQELDEYRRSQAEEEKWRACSSALHPAIRGSELVLFAESCVLIYSLERNAPVRLIKLAKKLEVSAVAVSDGGSLMLAGTRSGEIHIFDAKNWTLLRQVRAHSAPVTALRFAKGDRLSVSGGEDYMLRAYDILTGEPKASFNQETGFVGFVGIQTAEARILSTHYFVSVWDLPN